MPEPESSSPLTAITAALKAARAAVADAARLLRQHEAASSRGVPTKSDWLDQIAELLDEITYGCATERRARQRCASHRGRR